VELHDSRPTLPLWNLWKRNTTNRWTPKQSCQKVKWQRVCLSIRNSAHYTFSREISSARATFKLSTQRWLGVKFYLFLFSYSHKIRGIYSFTPMNNSLSFISPFFRNFVWKPALFFFLSKFVFFWWCKPEFWREFICYIWTTQKRLPSGSSKTMKSSSGSYVCGWRVAPIPSNLLTSPSWLSV